MTNEKYNTVMEILRRSEPRPEDPDGIVNKIMTGIRREKPESTFSVISGYLFGWVDVAWIRTSLVTASFLLLGYFSWQQHSLATEMQYIKDKINTRATDYDPSAALQRKLTIYRMEQMNPGVFNGQEDVGKLIDSLKEMNERYRVILEMINDDPSLRRALEKKLYVKSNI